MAAEQADRHDDLIRLAIMVTGKQPQDTTTLREELDEWLTTVPEEV
jgi:hypothetical protein